MRHLHADPVAAHLPLGRLQWKQVLSLCTRFYSVLPAVLRHSPHTEGSIEHCCGPHVVAPVVRIIVGMRKCATALGEPGSG